MKTKGGHKHLPLFEEYETCTIENQQQKRLFNFDEVWIMRGRDTTEANLCDRGASNVRASFAQSVNVLLHSSTVKMSNLVVYCYDNVVLVRRCRSPSQVFTEIKVERRSRQPRCTRDICDQLEVLRNRYRSDCNIQGGLLAIESSVWHHPRVLKYSETPAHILKTLGRFGRSFVSERGKLENKYFGNIGKAG